MENSLSDILINTRDLGGLISEDGSHIKPHSLIRSGKLYNISASDVETLENQYHVKTIIDLRTHSAIKSKPDVTINGATTIAVPLTSEKAGITMEASERSIFNSLQKIVMKMGGPNNVIEYTCNNYREFISQDDSLASFSKIFSIISSEEPAMLWHCSAGKDRAGVTSALVLSALDISVEQIYEDYLLTNSCLKNKYDKLRESAKAKGYSDEDIDAMSLLGIVDKRYLDAFFDEINKRYQSIDNFLSSLGVDKQLLKNKYLEK